MVLSTIRALAADPTVHARDLFHASVAMWEAWRVVGGSNGTAVLADGRFYLFVCGRDLSDLQRGGA